jgi:hypothetical protein
MQNTSRTEYEAIGFEVFAEDHLGYVVIQVATPQGTKVALRMRRSTFDNLAERIAKTHADVEKRAPNPRAS